MSDYLWDGSGAPDQEVQRIEALLSPLRLQSERPRKPRSRMTMAWVAAAACVVSAVGVWQYAPNRGERTEWLVANENGRALLSGESVRAHKEPIELQAESAGNIRLHPGSAMRVLESQPGRHHRLELQHGTIQALIWAPPGQLIVDTPSARAIDLGCQYELRVEKNGNGILRVQTGWVAFQAGDNEAFIPGGAACRTGRLGPGIPYFEDAVPEFRSALEQLERDPAGDALSTVLALARREDGLTLWHLLARSAKERRGRVFDRFSQVAPLPGDVVRDKAIAGDTDTLDRCWNALGLANAAWWREWKQPWRAGG